ncbi:hypothetical protein [Nocardia sp. NBC_01009]|uniref:hypothetical protein n=1 Tax=Nocardia sp. NBC_01009 TaxID=2975996 RepID=UPI00386EF316|nr:hypothetical protein OHA42_23490 [Nocardia sp. NBC_01009]
MNPFLTEVGKKLAEKWVTLLALPGVLFIAVAAIGSTLGHRRAFDAKALVDRMGQLTEQLGKAGNSAIVLCVASVLLASVGAGIAAQAATSLVQRAWFVDRRSRIDGPPPRYAALTWLRWLPTRIRNAHNRLCRLAIDHRSGRWDFIEAAFHAAQTAAADDAVLAELADARNRIALARPVKPTWMGDRVQVTGIRIRNEYGLDLTTCWPALSVVLPDGVSGKVDTARGSFDRSATLAGWAMLYVVLALAWWPAILIAIVVYVTARRRARSTLDSLAALTEAVVDIHCAALAESLNVNVPNEEFTPRIGREITARLRKGV